MEQPKVSVCMITYNHEDYIRDAIEGVLMQETDFNIELVVANDCSQDDTEKIVENYRRQNPELVKGYNNKTNLGMKSNFLKALKQCNGKYIALCEGDDYWTDPFKLQKQVEFMEKKEDVTLTCGSYKSLNVYSGNGKLINYCKNKRGGIDGFDFDLEDMKKGWLTKTLTVVFKKDALKEYYSKEYQYSRDIHLFYHAVKAGRGYYFNDCFGVYRIHKGGINSMKHGMINKNAAYDCYKELYAINQDSFTRYKSLQSSMGLFNYLLSKKNDQGILRMLKLLFKSISMIKGKDDMKIIMKNILPSKIKILVKKSLYS